MRFLKVIVFVMLGFFILALLAAFGGYLYYNNKYPVDNEAYPAYVGYINQEKTALNNSYKLCDPLSIYHVHHGAAEEGYAVNKKRFKESILGQYKNANYTDSGYLNFRFLVTCEGKPGWFETIQVDTEYNSTQFSEELVAQLLALTAQPDHWNTITFQNTAVDYYMYVSYKLKDGEITEILP